MLHISGSVRRSRPAGVAGLVLVDAPDETVFSSVPEPWPAMEGMARQASWAARVGVLRLFDPLRIATLPPARAAVLRPLIYKASAWQAIAAMLSARDESTRQLAALPPIAGELPMIVRWRTASLATFTALGWTASRRGHHQPESPRKAGRGRGQRPSHRRQSSRADRRGGDRRGARQPTSVIE